MIQMVVFKAENIGDGVAENCISRLVDRMGTYKSSAIKILQKNGLNEIKTENRYDLEKYFDILKLFYKNLIIIY